MTRFYWVETQAQATDDAAVKGYAADKWIFCETKAALQAVVISDYEGIYLKTGTPELEQEFSRIMRRNRPKWLC